MYMINSSGAFGLSGDHSTQKIGFEGIKTIFTVQNNPRMEAVRKRAHKFPPIESQITVCRIEEKIYNNILLMEGKLVHCCGHFYNTTYIKSFKVYKMFD